MQPKPLLLLVLLMLAAAAAFAQGRRQCGFACSQQNKVRREPFSFAERRQAAISRPGTASFYYWDSTAAWHHATNYAYQYDAQGQLTEEIGKSPATGQNQFRNALTYNAAGLETEYLSQFWNGTAWENDGREQTTYDAQNNETEYRSESWDGSAWTLDYGYRVANTYNTSNQLTELTYQEYDNGTWVNSDRITYSFAPNGHWNEVLISTWNNNSWEPDTRFTYLLWVNFSAMQPRSFTQQQWDGSAWQDVSRETYLYVGSITTNLVEAYDAGTWVNDSRFTETLDSHGNFSNFLAETWQSGNWALDYENNMQLSYNSSNDLTQTISRIRDANNPVFVNFDRYVYANFITFTKRPELTAVQDAGLTLYPNPTRATVAVMLAEPSTAAALLQVRTLTGQLVLSQTIAAGTLQAGATLDVSALSAGAYLLEVVQDGKLSRQKLVKQ